MEIRNNIIQRIESIFTQVSDRMDNIEGRMSTLEKDLTEYCEHNPKIDEQWAEERLRALELMMKIKMEEGTISG